MAGVRDRALADRDVEHRQVLVLQAGRADDRVVLVDVGLDLADLGLRVAERLERQVDRAVDDLHLAAADELLELDQREVRLDAGRVAVHQEGDRPGRGEHRRLGVAVAVGLAEGDRLVPALAGRVQQRLLDQLVVDLVGGGLVHPHHLVVGLAVLRVRLVGADRAGDLGRAAVAAAGHQGGDRAGDGAALVGVVGQAVRHQQRAEVGVAQPELAELAGVLADLLGRVARRADDDLLRQEDDVHRVGEVLDVERPVLVAEPHQVQRGEVAGRVVDVHVLASTGSTR